MNSVQIGATRSLFSAVIIIAVAGLYALSRFNYLLFHGIAELFSVVIACTIFIFFWNTREYHDTDMLALLGIPYLFVSLIDMFHTLAYKGMGVFSINSANLATQLWISARYYEGAALLLLSLFYKRKVKTSVIMIIGVSVFILIVLTIFVWPVFPVCYIEGSGLTMFKKVSEYIITGLLSVALVLFFLAEKPRKSEFNSFIIISITLTMASEILFTFYVSVYGISNFIGHILKIISFYFIYKAVISSGLKNPVNMLFANLKTSERRFKDIFDSAPLGYQTIDQAGNILHINEAWSTLTGFGGTDAIHKPFKSFMTGESALRFDSVLETAETTGVSTGAELTLRTKESREVHITADIRKSGYSATASPEYLCILKDITDKKKYEDRINLSLKEKDILIREVHHRVKNNLSLINAMLGMKSRDTELPAVQQVFLDCQGRIQSIALVHEQMYSTNNVAELPFANYISDLVRGISTMHYSTDRSIDISISIEPVTLDLNRAIPLGLIITELITNAYKYAFPHRENGRIEIRMYQKLGDYFLQIQDNGAGLPESINIHNPQSFGLTMVKLLAEQIGGNLALTRNNETLYTLTFPVKNDEQYK